MTRLHTIKRVRTECADGWVLQGDHAEPAGPPRAVALLGHAMMADRRTMDLPRGKGLGSVLVSRGFAVINFDARGHGRSGPGALEGGSWTFDDFPRLDVPAMLRFARDAHPGLPVGFVGHSLLGHAALIAAGLEPRSGPEAIVALACNLWKPSLEPSGRHRIAKGSLLRLWTLVTAAAGRFPAKKLELGTADEPVEFVRHFLQMWRRDTLSSPDGAVDYESALARAAIPVLSVTSAGDRLLARPAAVNRFMALARAAQVSHRALERDAHGWAPSHMELVTSQQCRPLWVETSEWLADQLESSSSRRRLASVSR